MYPPRLVAAILRALRQSMRAAGCGEAQGLMGRDRQLTIAALEAGPTLEEPELLSLPDSTDSAQEFRGRSTGLTLNPEIVKRARELEMQHMGELKVREDSDRDTCIAGTGRPPIPTDWVDIDKGDPIRLNYRSRLICQETRGWPTVDVEDWAATFAARLQLSLMMTGPRSQVEGDDGVLMLFGHFPSTSPLTACTSCLRDHSMAKSTSCSNQCIDCEMREHHSTDRCLM